MKIVRYHEKGAPDVLRVEDAPKPSASEGQALIRVEACGISYGEVLQRGGRFYPVPVTLPAHPGLKVAGVVEQVGPGADAALVGKRVYVTLTGGGYSEYVVAPASGCIVLPESVTSVTAVAVLSDGTTAAVLLKHAARLQPGQSVFVPAAAGGLGYMAVQLARLYGAGLVIGAASSPEKRKRVLDLGANAVVDYTQEGWAAQVIAANGGQGVDIALEMTGGPIFYQTLEIVRPTGIIVNYGNASDTESLVNPRQLLLKGLTLAGFTVRHFPSQAAAAQREVLAFIAAGRLSALSTTYPFERAGEAHAAIEQRRSQGRQILVPA